MDTTNDGKRPDGDPPDSRPAPAPILHLWTVIMLATRRRAGSGEFGHTGGCVACGTKQDAMQWGEEEVRRRYPLGTGWTDHSVNVEAVPAGLVLQVANGYRQTNLSLQETQTSERTDDGPNPRT